MSRFQPPHKRPSSISLYHAIPRLLWKPYLLQCKIIIIRMTLCSSHSVVHVWRYIFFSSLKISWIPSHVLVDVYTRSNNKRRHHTKKKIKKINFPRKFSFIFLPSYFVGLKKPPPLNFFYLLFILLPFAFHPHPYHLIVVIDVDVLV